MDIDMECFGSLQNMQLADWLEGVLKRYCQQVTDRTLALESESSKRAIQASLNNNNIGNSDTEGGDSSGSEDEDGMKLGAEANATSGSIFFLITSIKFDKLRSATQEDVLDDLLRVEISYYVGEPTVCLVEHFLINVSRRFESKEPTLDKILETSRREIDFFTKLVPKLEDLIHSCNSNLKLGLPTCFYGQYEVDNAEDRAAVKRELREAFGFEAKSNENLARNEIRSIFILHDLEKLGFQPKGPEKLTLCEARMVIKEIAQVHAASWVLQMKSIQIPLFDTFPFLLHPRRAVPVCVTLCETGIKPFTKILTQRLKQEPDGPDLVRRLKAYQHNLTQTFFSLMLPPEAPAPYTLVHLDLQVGNIWFRYADKGGSPTECRVTNWKLASVGSPMHDLAFLLLSSIPPQIRRHHAAELIHYYYEVFESTANKLKFKIPFDLEDLKKEYDRSLLFAILLVIGNVEEGQDLDSESLEAFIEALRDLAKSNTIKI